MKSKSDYITKKDLATTLARLSWITNRENSIIPKEYCSGINLVLQVIADVYGIGRFYHSQQKIESKCEEK